MRCLGGKGCVLVARSLNYRNRHHSGDLTPTFPAMKLREIVRAHQPNEADGAMFREEAGERVERITSPVGDFGRAHIDKRRCCNFARFGNPLLNWR